MPEPNYFQPQSAARQAYDVLKKNFLARVPVDDWDSLQKELADAAQQPPVSLWPLIYVECLLKQANDEGCYDLLIEAIVRYSYLFSFPGEVKRADFEQNGVNSTEEYNRLLGEFKLSLETLGKNFESDEVQEAIQNKAAELFPEPTESPSLT